MFESRTRPCLLHQIKRCSAPCTGEIAPDDYAELVREATRFPVRQEPGGEGASLPREMEKASQALDFERAGDLSRPPRGLVGDPVAAGHQSARRRGSRRVRDPSGRRLQLRAGVLLPHRPELGQPRLFPEGRPLAAGGRGAELLPRAILRRQAVPALRPALGRSPERELLAEALSTKSGHSVEVAAPQRGEKKDLIDHALANAREALGAQARGNLLAADTAEGAGRDLRPAARAAPDRGLRQQPYPGLERGRRHDRRRPGRLREEPVSQVQYPLAPSSRPATITA